VAAPAGFKLDMVANKAADDVVAIDKGDYSRHKEQIKRRYPEGFDTVVEATGVSRLMEESIEYAAMGAQIIAYGVYAEAEEIRINPYEIFKRELTIKGSFAQTHCFDRALRYLESGRVDVSGMITHRLPLESFADALELMEQGKAIKIVLEPPD